MIYLDNFLGQYGKTEKRRYPFWPQSSFLVFIRFCIIVIVDLLIGKLLSIDDWNHKPDSIAQVYFLLRKKWVICIFCTNSFTVFILGRYLNTILMLYLNFSPCENDGGGWFRFWYPLMSLHCQSSYTFSEVILACLFIYFFTYYCWYLVSCT